MKLRTWTSPQPLAYIMTETRFSVPPSVQSKVHTWAVAPFSQPYPYSHCTSPEASPERLLGKQGRYTRTQKHMCLDPSPPGAPETYRPLALSSLTNGNTPIPLPLGSPHSYNPFHLAPYPEYLGKHTHTPAHAHTYPLPILSLWETKGYVGPTFCPVTV